MTLEKRINSLTSFYRKYARVIKMSVVSIGLSSSLAFYCSEGIVEGLTIESKIKRAKKEGREIRLVHKGNLMKPEVKNCIEIFDKEKGEFKTEYYPWKRMEHHYLVTLPLMIGFLYGMLRKRPRDRLIGELKKSDLITRTGIELSVAGTFFTYFNKPLMALQPIPFFCVGTSMTFILIFGTNTAFNKYKVWQKYQKAQQKGNYDEITCKFYNCLSLEKMARKALKSGDLPGAAQRLYERTKIEREFDDIENICFHTYRGCIGREYSFVFSRIKARRNPTYANYLKLLLENLAMKVTPATDDLEEAVEKLPEKEVELKIIVGALTSDEEKTRKLWTEVYHILNKEGKINAVDEKSKNEVGFADCNTLGVRFVVKKQARDLHRKEIEQTKARNRYMGDNKRIVIPEIIQGFEEGENGILISARFYGENFHEFLKGVPAEQQTLWLRYALEGGHEAAKCGISDCIEDRYEKIQQDIESLWMIDRRDKDELSDNIQACLRYSDKFEPICDVDLIKDNILVLNDERLALIDHEERMKSDPVYMLVKLLEYRSTLDYDEVGIRVRNELIRHHFISLGYDLDRGIMEAHYYSSVPLKALSYLGFSREMDGKEEIRKDYLDSAERSLELVVSRYTVGYSNEQIIQLKSVSRCIKRIKKQLGFAILT